MSVAQIIVIAGGAGLIAFLWWFFFGERGAASPNVTEAGVQEVHIRVEGSYQPDRIHVETGRPVRLVFDRQEVTSCSEIVTIPELGITKPLPAYKKTAVEFTPTQPGEMDFACGMNMYRGQLIVEQAGTENGRRAVTVSTQQAGE